MVEAEDPQPRNGKPQEMPQSIALAPGGRAVKGMIYVSYCGFNHEIDLETPKERSDVKNRNSQVTETTKVRLHPSPVAESNEKKLMENYSPIPSPTRIPRKTPELNLRNEQTKTVDKPSKGVLASTALWLSQGVCCAVRTCRRALGWVGRRFFHR